MLKEAAESYLENDSKTNTARTQIFKARKAGDKEKEERQIQIKEEALKKANSAKKSLKRYIDNINDEQNNANG